MSCVALGDESPLPGFQQAHHPYHQLNLELSRGSDHDLGTGGARSRSNGFNLLDDIHALNDRSEDAVLAIQPGGIGSAKEELRSVGVGSSIG